MKETQEDRWPETFMEMLERGVLPTELRRTADEVFAVESFTLAILHAHLLIEKALNARLAEKGIPPTLLGPEGLEFRQKCQTYQELRGRDPKSATWFDVLNALRNNIAHDFWDDAECIRVAFRRMLRRKRHSKVVEDAASMGIDAVKLLFLLLAVDVGIVVPSSESVARAFESTHRAAELEDDERE